MRRNLRRAVKSDSVAEKSRSINRAVCETLESRRLLSLSVPLLYTIAGASKHIFLDFDGNDAFRWNNGDGIGNTDDGSHDYIAHGADSTDAPLPAFDIDGDATNFSADELSEIQQIWSRVATKFSPFNIDVTTIDPGNRSDNATIQVIIGGSATDWYGQDVLGVSAQDGFQLASMPNTAFVFSADQSGDASSDRTRIIGERAAHEIGHELGLFDQHSSTGALYSGNGVIAPIMGDSTADPTARGIWWTTNGSAGQNSSDPVRNELNTLTNLEGPLTYRSDDYPGIINWHTMQFNGDGSLLPVSGVIENTQDVDSFSITGVSGIDLMISTPGNGGTLSPDVALFDLTEGQYSSPQTLAIDGLIKIYETGLDKDHAYRLDVFSRGNSASSTTQPGNVGQYTITGAGEIPLYFDANNAVEYINGYFQPNNIVVGFSYYNGNAADLRIIFLSSSGTLLSSYSTNDVTQIGSIAIHPSAGYDDQITFDLYREPNANLIPPPTYVNGGGGDDTFIVIGRATTPVSYEIHDATHVSWLIEDTTLASIEHVEVHNYSNIDSAYNLYGWSADTSLSIYGNNAVDELLVYASAETEADGERVYFDGGAGSADNVVFLSPADGTNHSIEGNEVIAVDASAALIVDFANTEKLNFFGSAGNDSYDIYTTTVPISIDAGQGDDTLGVGSGFYPLAGAAASVTFYGDGGTDQINLDDEADNTARIYTITPTVLVGTGGSSINYDGTTEALALYGGATGCSFNVSGSSPTIFNLFGNTGADFFQFSPGTTINGAVDGGGGSDRFTVSDTSNANPFEADWYADHLDRLVGSASNYTTYAINYAGIESMNYTGGSATNTIKLYGTPATPAGSAYSLTGGSGNDAITAYPRDAAGNSTFLTPMSINGGAGANNVGLDDSASTTAALYDFESGNGATNVKVDSSLFTMNATIASLFIYAGSGNDQFDINNISYLSGLNIHGDDGDDSINIAPASQNVYANISPLAFSFDGGTGQDRMSFNNLHAPNAWTETMSNTRLTVTQNSASLRYDFDYTGIETIYSTGAALADTFNLSSQAAGSVWQIDGGPGLDTVLLLAGNAAFMSSQDLGGLSMFNGAFASIGTAGATLITQSLSLGGNNTLDLNDGNLIYDYTGASRIATVQSLIRTGRAGGAWTGKGITSQAARDNALHSTTLGAIEATDYKSIYGAGATFNNFAIDNTAVLVKYTYYGDTNFNGKVDGGDYSRIDAAFNSQHTAGNIGGWFNGDFDGNGKVDGADYSLIDSAFNAQGSALRPPTASLLAPIAAPTKIKLIDGVM